MPEFAIAGAAATDEGGHPRFVSRGVFVMEGKDEEIVAHAQESLVGHIEPGEILQVIEIRKVGAPFIAHQVTKFESIDVKDAPADMHPSE